MGMKTGAQAESVLAAPEAGLATWEYAAQLGQALSLSCMSARSEEPAPLAPGCMWLSSCSTAPCWANTSSRDRIQERGRRRTWLYDITGSASGRLI